MTKRILALLLAAIFALSCCMMVACGGNDDGKTSDKTSAGGDKTSDKTSAGGDKTSNNPNDDKTSGDQTSGDNTSDGGDNDDDDVDPDEADANAFAQEGADRLAFGFYSKDNPVESWEGKRPAASGDDTKYLWFQFCFLLNISEADFSEAIGTEDYAYTWKLNIREAAPVGEENTNKWESFTCDTQTVYQFGGENSNNIYRICPGKKADMFELDKEYEIVIEVWKGDEQIGCSDMAMYFTWTETTQASYQRYLDAISTGASAPGADGNGGGCPAWYDQLPAELK